MKDKNMKSSFFHHCNGKEKKPIEIYMFIDPLCPECWALEPIVKKLKIEYGRYISVKHVLGGRLPILNISTKNQYESIAELWEKTATRTGMSCDGNLWLENPVSAPHVVFVAIKAAELQGRKAGIKFLRKVQEAVFLRKEDISQINVLEKCAIEAGLDVHEFNKDLHSESAAKAFQCDLKITSEMDVHEIPSFVFFNENIEEEGIKITGYYPYDVYKQILEEMLPFRPERATPPPIEAFLKHFHFVASTEIAIVYDMTINEVDKEMKKLQLKQLVEQVPAKYGTFWKYNRGYLDNQEQ